MSDWNKYGTVRQANVHKLLNPIDEYGLRGYCLDRVQNMLDLNEPPEVRETLERILASGKPEDYARWLIGCVVAGELLSNTDEREKKLENVPEPATDDDEEYARYLSEVIAIEPDSETDDLENFDRIKSRLATLPATPWIVGDN